MVVSTRIAEVQATAAKQPQGYVDYLLSRGKVEGDLLVLDDAAQDDVREKYPLPGQAGVFNLAMLKAAAPYQPAGYVDFVLTRGKMKGEFVILNNQAIEELRVKFPPSTRSLVYKLAEILANPHRRPPAMVEFFLQHGKISGDFLILEPPAVQLLHGQLDRALTVKYDIAHLVDHADQRPEGFVDFVLAHAKIADGSAIMHGKLVQEMQRKLPGKATQIKHSRAELAAEAAQRPEGYLEAALARGIIEGDFVILNGADLSALNQAFPAPIKFNLAQLQASAHRRPRGLIDYVLEHGTREGDHVILDAHTAQKFKQKFPQAFLPPPEEPSLAEMAANFSGAMAGWAKVGFKTVAREVYEKRLGVCNSCEHWDAQARAGLGKCKICGCSKFKFWLASSVCPDKPPRW